MSALSMGESFDYIMANPEVMSPLKQFIILPPVYYVKQGTKYQCIHKWQFHQHTISYWMANRGDPHKPIVFVCIHIRARNP